MSRCLFFIFVGIQSSLMALLQPLQLEQNVESARAERLAFEQKRGTIVLDRDSYVFDQAPAIVSDTTIDGRGKATWRNGWQAGKHPLNSTAIAWPIGASGWIDPISVGDNRSAVTLRDPAQSANYPAGRLVYVWAAGQGPQPWHAPGVDNSKFGLINQRRKVVEQNGAVLTLDAAVDPRVTDICWLADAQPIGNVSRDSFAIPGVKPGVYWLTSGKSVADELRGEWVEVANEKLKRRSSRKYEAAAIAAMPRIENVTLRGITFAPSPNPQGSALFVKFVRNWRIEDCTFQGHVLIAGATDIELVRCRFEGPLQLNTSTRVTIRDCQLKSVSTDEADVDTVVRDCVVSAAKGNAIGSGIDCARMTIEQVTILNPGESPLMIGGPDNRLSNIRIVGDQHGSYLHGSRLFVRNLRSDNFVACYGGDGQRLDDVRAKVVYLGWINLGPSSGTYRNTGPIERKPTARRWIEVR